MTHSDIAIGTVLTVEVTWAICHREYTFSIYFYNITPFSFDNYINIFCEEEMHLQIWHFKNTTQLLAVEGLNNIVLLLEGCNSAYIAPSAVHVHWLMAHGYCSLLNVLLIVI